MMEVIKNLAEVLVIPLVMALLLCVTALALRRYKRVRIGNWLLGSAGVLLYLFSIRPVADLLIGPLERRYAPLPEDGIPAPHYVAVLGSSYSPRDGVPITAALDADGLARIVEGVRLVRRWPEARLVVIGGPVGPRAPALGYQRLALDLGVDASRIHVLDRPHNTAAESAALAALVQSASTVLVTSAFHMPRAMSWMEKRGLHPLAAPTAHRVDPSVENGMKALLPNAAALKLSEFALREYLALLAISVEVGA